MSSIEGARRMVDDFIQSKKINHFTQQEVRQLAERWRKEMNIDDSTAILTCILLQYTTF